ncbi:M48 family metalloprotease [Nodosilinea sp. E11]|uniref:M48 family metalloprotease n=1 Tax=Nodosilinea sp. E11 TaxID=3037479 RepID=UPI0029342402|nr:M48 family metalloprotease [Nodosilinea sp. E11]WOD38804.1 M48 family metalloprotease [Nodosilinea sp. E11]
MAQPIDPNSPTPNSDRRPGRSVEEVYRQAVSAFKGHQYAQSLVLFRRLGQLPPSSPYYPKALMGQVRSHQRLGQLVQARRVCRQLLDSDSPAASQWAKQTLSQLPQAKEGVTPPAEGVTPPAEAQPPAKPTRGQASRSDLSGFVPLEGTVSTPQPPRQTPPAAASGPSPSPWPGAARDEDFTPNDIDRDPSAPEAEYRSLFHYQQLNQQSEPEAASEQAPGQRLEPPLESAPSRLLSQSAAGQRSTAQTVAPKTSSIKPRSEPQRPLPKRPLELWAGQGLTAIAVLWAINWAVHAALRTVDSGLRWVRWPLRLSLPGAQQSYTLWIVIGLVLLALASPWILDFALARWHRQQPLTPRQLQAHSPSALRLLHQMCRQQDWQLPELRLISDPAPLCFSYGWLPRNTRIVISQGLLESHSDQALAALYSYELARMVNGMPVLSAMGLLLLLLHSGYRWLAEVGNGLSNLLLRNSLGLLSSTFYGLFWLLRQSALWLSRLCCSWGDRRAVALTQHPDYLAEGLLQLTGAIATHLQRQGTLHPLQISLEILMPISHRQAITPGSLLISAEPQPDSSLMLITLDGQNPYRQWLRVNASHIPLGERLRWLNQQALLRGQPSISSDHQPAIATTTVSLLLLWLQKAPLAGLMLGGGLAMGLWFLGGIFEWLGWQRLSWLYQDPSLLWGGLWLGLGLGLMVRINALFPDAEHQLPPATATLSSGTVAALLQNTSPLPVQGQPVTLRGKLRGSVKIENWGCQELYLDDPSGLVKLINPVPLGSIQGLLQAGHHPLRWIGRIVTVKGWGRYGGGMLWVDIHQIQLDQRSRFQAHGPAWATLLSLTSSLIGIIIIVRGG